MTQLPQNEPETHEQAAYDDLISEQEAADILNVSLKTLRNMVYSERIPLDCYTTAVNGKRMYYRTKLLGL